MTSPNGDLTGRTTMITGFTSGVGQAAAMALAGLGADLVLTCRSRAKGEATIAAIRAAHPKADPVMIVGDLGVMDDVRRIAEEFEALGRPLHVLLNNAGLVLRKRSVTPDGFETTFAVNHLGHFLLTNLLLARLRGAGDARVVSTASDAHKFAGKTLDFDDLQAEKRYSTFGVYGRSKLANILFTRELARRETEAGSGVRANAFHPGFVGSNFSKNNGAIARIVMTAISPFARSSERGAETGVYLCASPDVADITGGYFYDRKPLTPSASAQNAETAARLWSVSAKLVGLAA